MTETPSAWKIQQAMSVALAFAARLRESDPSIAEDEDSFLSALESETDATEILTRVLRASVEADSLADAADARIKDLTARRDRFKRRRDDARSAAFGIMDALSLPKFVTPEFTVGIRAGVAATLITDETEIPPELMRQAAPTPDKAEITKRLKAGETIPGCELANGMPSLSVRTK